MCFPTQGHHFSGNRCDSHISSILLYMIRLHNTQFDTQSNWMQDFHRPLPVRHYTILQKLSIAMDSTSFVCLSKPCFRSSPRDGVVEGWRRCKTRIVRTAFIDVHFPSRYHCFNVWDKTLASSGSSLLRWFATSGSEETTGHSYLQLHEFRISLCLGSCVCYSRYLSECCCMYILFDRFEFLVSP